MRPLLLLTLAFAPATVGGIPISDSWIVPDPANPGRFLAVCEPPEGPSPRRVTMAYDNWFNDANFVGHVRTGGDEVGDDINAVRGAGGFVDQMGYSIFNLSQTDSLTGIRRTWRFRDTEGRLIFEASLSVVIVNPILPMTGRRIFQFMRPGNIIVDDDFYVTLAFSQPIGADLADLGQVYGGPPAVGSSSRFYRNFTTGQNLDLGSPDSTSPTSSRPTPSPPQPPRPPVMR